MYRHWANLLMHEKWEDVEKATAAYEQSLLAKNDSAVAIADETELAK
jgi:3-phenylpropionate/trans-cinnamate dioxygenase alpha subunit